MEAQKLHRAVKGKRLIYWKHDKIESTTQPVHWSRIPNQDYLPVKEQMITKEGVLAVWEGIDEAVVAWVEILH